jgi:hypothetical protein
MVRESITVTVNIDFQIQVLPLVGSIRSYRPKYAI